MRRLIDDPHDSPDEMTELLRTQDNDVSIAGQEVLLVSTLNHRIDDVWFAATNVVCVCLNFFLSINQRPNLTAVPDVAIIQVRFSSIRALGSNLHSDTHRQLVFERI